MTFISPTKDNACRPTVAWGMMGNCYRLMGNCYRLVEFIMLGAGRYFDVSFLRKVLFRTVFIPKGCFSAQVTLYSNA